MSQGGRTLEPNNIVSTYVDETLKSQLVELAKKNERSVSAELRRALKRHIQAENGADSGAEAIA